MSIIVQCYHCQSRLELDDGFRGGVCRCRKCGSLLKVPATADTPETSRVRPNDPGTRPSDNRPRDPNEDPGLSSSTLRDKSPQRPSAPPSTSSGALSSSSLRSRVPGNLNQNQATSDSKGQDKFTATVPHSPMITRKLALVNPTADKSPSTLIFQLKKNKPLVWATGGFIFLFLLASIFILVAVLSHHQPPLSPAQAQISSGTASVSLNTGFLGIPLTGKQIVWSLDGSSANLNSFNLIAACVQQAITKLAPNQQVKFAIWTPDGLQVIPKKGWLHPSHATNAENILLNYSPYGSTISLTAMNNTLKLGGDQVIFVTAKVFLSDANLPADVNKSRRASQRIDVVSVNGEQTELPLLTKQSGGLFRFISVSDLQSTLGQ